MCKKLVLIVLLIRLLQCEFSIGNASSELHITDAVSQIFQFTDFPIIGLSGDKFGYIYTTMAGLNEVSFTFVENEAISFPAVNIPMPKQSCALCAPTTEIIVNLSGCKINDDKILILGVNAADDILRGVIVDDQGNVGAIINISNNDDLLGLNIANCQQISNDKVVITYSGVTTSLILDPAMPPIQYNSYLVDYNFQTNTLGSAILIDSGSDESLNLANAKVSVTTDNKIQVLMSEKLSPPGSDDFTLNLKRQTFDSDWNKIGVIEQINHPTNEQAGNLYHAILNLDDGSHRYAITYSTMDNDWQNGNVIFKIYDKDNNEQCQYTTPGYYPNMVLGKQSIYMAYMENLKVKPSNPVENIIYSKVYGIEINIFNCQRMGNPVELNGGNPAKVFMSYAPNSNGAVGISLLKEKNAMEFEVYFVKYTQLECHHKCGDCSGTADTCGSCSDPNRDSGDDCNCSAGWYEKGVPFCGKCDIKCGSCQPMTGACTTCSDDSNNTRDENNGCQCKPGFNEVGQAACSRIQCDAQTQRFDIDTNSCVCYDGFYKDSSNKCQKCHYTCNKCSGGAATQCTECNYTRKLSDTNECLCKSEEYIDIDQHFGITPEQGKEKIFCEFITQVAEQSKNSQNPHQAQYEQILAERNLTPEQVLNQQIQTSNGTSPSGQCPEGCKNCDENFQCQDCPPDSDEFFHEGKCVPCYWYQGVCVAECPEDLRKPNEKTRICEDDDGYTLLQIIMMIVAGLLFLFSVALLLYSRFSKVKVILNKNQQDCQIDEIDNQNQSQQQVKEGAKSIQDEEDNSNNISNNQDNTHNNLNNELDKDQSIINTRNNMNTSNNLISVITDNQVDMSQTGQKAQQAFDEINPQEDNQEQIIDDGDQNQNQGAQLDDEDEQERNSTFQ